nr:hypothetical protein [Pseudomonas bharatica]
MRITGTTLLDNTSALVLANDVEVDSTLSVAGNNDLTLNGVLSGNGTLNKNGLANLTLGGTNTFAGILNILSGSLTATNGGAWATRRRSTSAAGPCSTSTATPTSAPCKAAVT